MNEDLAANDVSVGQICPQLHDDGELGCSPSHAIGAAFDNPDLVVACLAGDGEAVVEYDEDMPEIRDWHWRGGHA